MRNSVLANILLFTLISILDSCEKKSNEPDSYDCINGSCYESYGGAYKTLNDCQAFCANNIVGSYECISGNCQEIAGGQYTSLSDCQNNCGNVSNTYDCVNGNCVVSGSGNGQYNSLTDCQTACSSTIKYDCVSGNCQPVSGGTYASLTDCQNACSSSSIVSNPGNGVTDVDGNFYPSVVLGNGQEWMTKNLRTTRYSNGDVIPQISNPVDWGSATGPGWCYYDNDPSNNNVYGKIYNWYAMSDNYNYPNTRNICPNGWHIPALNEWQALVNYAGGTNVAGGHLKETGFLHWGSPNTGATNLTGFTGVPSGYRQHNAQFWSLGTQFTLWITGNPTAPGFNSPYPYVPSLSYVYAKVLTSTTGDLSKVRSGLACRCIKN